MKLFIRFDFVFQIFADLVSLMTSNILGLFAFYQVDKQQRTAFLETRQSLKMKLSIEEQSAEQVKKPLLHFRRNFFTLHFLHIGKKSYPLRPSFHSNKYTRKLPVSLLTS